jgi:hypothetical protein
MAIRFTCPCGLTLEAEDQYAGQPTVCPQCGKQKKIPSPSKVPVAKLLSPSPVPQPVAADPGFEVIEDDEPVVAAPKAKPRPALTMRADEDDRPVRRKKVTGDDRPRAKATVEDDDDRPRKRTPKKKAVSASGTAAKRLWKILGGIGLLLLGVGLLAAWWFIDVRRAGKLLVWGIVAVVVGLGGIGTGMFGTVDADGGSDYDSEDDD